MHFSCPFDIQNQNYLKAFMPEWPMWWALEWHAPCPGACGCRQMKPALCSLESWSLWTRSSGQRAPPSLVQATGSLRRVACKMRVQCACLFPPPWTNWISTRELRVIFTWRDEKMNSPHCDGWQPNLSGRVSDFTVCTVFWSLYPATKMS